MNARLPLALAGETMFPPPAPLSRSGGQPPAPHPPPTSPQQESR